MAAPKLIWNWAVAKFVPNLKNQVERLWSTRMATVPRKFAYRNTPINKWPRGGPANVKMELPIGFSKKGTPFEQKYGWTRPDASGVTFKPGKLVRGGAQFLPKGSKVGQRVVTRKAKEVAKPAAALAGGGFIASQQSKLAEKRTRGPKMVNPSAKALTDWGRPPGVNVSQRVTVNVGGGPQQHRQSPFNWRRGDSGIEKYKDVPTGPKGGNKITMQKLNKKAGFKSPYASDIAKFSKSGYHVFKGGSKGAKSFQAAYGKAKKGSKFFWAGTGKMYAKP